MLCVNGGALTAEIQIGMTFVLVFCDGVPKTRRFLAIEFGGFVVKFLHGISFGILRWGCCDFDADDKCSQ